MPMSRNVRHALTITCHLLTFLDNGMSLSGGIMACHFVMVLFTFHSQTLAIDFKPFLFACLQNFSTSDPDFRKEKESCG